MLPTALKGGIRKRLLSASPPADGGSAGSAPAGPLRGGVCQRAAAASASSSATTTPTDLPLNRSLKIRWGKGEISSPLVVEFASAAAAQGAAGLDRLAHAGGNHPQNVQRSLLAAFGKPKGAPDFTWAPVRTARGRVILPFLLPHQWFRSLFANRQALWEQSIEGHARAAGEFWESMRHHPFVVNHDFVKPENWDKVIPLGIHGDAGAFSHQDAQWRRAGRCGMAGRRSDVLMTMG